MVGFRISGSGFLVVASALLAGTGLSGCQKTEHTATTAERLKNVEVRQQTEPDSYLPRKSVDYMADIKNLKDTPEKAKAAQQSESTPAPASAPASAPAAAPAGVPANVPARPAETRPAPAPVAASPAPVAAPAAPPPVAEPARKTETAADTGAAAQNAYFNNLRTYIGGIKRYPTSREARQQRPAGTVKLWLEISRDGRFKDAGVEQSSNSLILDQAALSTVRQGNYPAFPAEAWAGQPSHRFTFSLEYSLSE